VIGYTTPIMMKAEESISG